MKVIVTGGAGFIGSAFVRLAIKSGWHVLNIDKLTYAANLQNVAEVDDSPDYSFLQTDICNKAAMMYAIATFKPDAIVNMAAESHVDRSIAGAGEFIQTNIVGTYNMLECALEYFRTLDDAAKKRFRFHHVSTDEVYGSLGEEGLFTENTSYDPSSPYSASKACSDHLVRAWYKTYGLPVTISNCSNNYGPYQFPEKLIPVMISNALNDKALPVYGNGKNIRDWLYVDDHVDAIMRILEKDRVGETYNIGGNEEHSNIDIVHLICDTLDAVYPRADKKSYRLQVKFVADRPGHDFRYAIDSSKIKSQLGWTPAESFKTGMRKTIDWYVTNQDWYASATNKNAIPDNKKRERA